MYWNLIVGAVHRTANLHMFIFVSLDCGCVSVLSDLGGSSVLYADIRGVAPMNELILVDLNRGTAQMTPKQYAEYLRVNKTLTLQDWAKVSQEKPNVPKTTNK